MGCQCVSWDGEGKGGHRDEVRSNTTKKGNTSPKARCRDQDWSHSVLLPEQAAELLPWYMQWSQDLAAEMHQRRLDRNEARRTESSLISYRPCDCASDWRCEPYNACFIHESCFCPGSGSFPPVKPPRS